jgi:hypothetical protein
MTTRALPGVASVCAVALLFSNPVSFAQSIAIDGASNNVANRQFRFNATGGTGPYSVQRANLANDPWCSIATLAAGNNIAVSGDGPQAFFRVRDLANAPATRFTANLSGTAAGTPSTGDGLGTFEVNGNTLSFDIAFRNLSSATTLAHIHAPADTANSAGIIIDFAPYIVPGFGTTNGRIVGSVTLSAANKALIFDGKAYVNIHTVNFGGGEIRGQITPATFRFVMSSVGERPNPTASGGYALGMLNLIGNQATYHVTYQGLNSPATQAHIHGPGAMSNTAPVMFWFQPTNNYGVSGTLSGRTNLTPAQIAALVDGKGYANIHTTNYPAGELRGQVLPFIGESPFSAELTGAAEKPNAVVTTGTGFVGCGLQSNVLWFFLMYRGLPSPAVAAHIHGAAVSTNTAPVIHDIVPFHRGPLSTQGVFAGSVVLTPSEITNLYSGDLYMNIHTANHPAGEIRGQLCPTIMPVFLSATNEPGAIASSASGAGFVGLLGKQFSVGVNYRDLTTNASNAHLHGPGLPGQSAGVVIPFNNNNYWSGGFGINGFLIGSEPTTDAIVSYIVDGLTYVNVHSTNYAGGEIRGQVFVP